MLIVEYLRKHGIPTKISEEVRVARRRFGRYEVIDFLAVLFGYAISGDRTLEAFYQHLQPFAVAFKVGRFSGQDFTLQPDGTLRCPANQSLTVHERRREADGSLRMVYGASIRSCHPCPLREQCQWNGGATTKPRQVSVLLHPVVVGSAPLAELESQGSSAGLHSSPSEPSRRGPGRTWEGQGFCHSQCYS